MTMIYNSPSSSVEGQKQKWQRILTPLLKKILDNDVEIVIGVDKHNNLCINKTPIGNIEKISNFEIYDCENALLQYLYNGKQRIIDFGELYDFFKPLRKSEVITIYEMKPNGEHEIVWAKLKPSGY